MIIFILLLKQFMYYQKNLFGFRVQIPIGNYIQRIKDVTFVDDFMDYLQNIN